MKKVAIIRAGDVGVTVLDVIIANIKCFFGFHRWYLAHKKDGSEDKLYCYHCDATEDACWIDD